MKNCRQLDLAGAFFPQDKKPPGDPWKVLQREDNDSNLTSVCSTLGFGEHFELWRLHSIQSSKFLWGSHGSQHWGAWIQEGQFSFSVRRHLREGSVPTMAGSWTAFKVQPSRWSMSTTLPESIAKLRSDSPGREQTSRSHGDRPMWCGE